MREIIESRIKEVKAQIFYSNKKLEILNSVPETNINGFKCPTRAAARARVRDRLRRQSEALKLNEQVLMHLTSGE